MSWLVALAAFAGIMAIFSTVVTVAVEAFHKALSLRRSGLQEMLRSMHLNVVRRLDASLAEKDFKGLRNSAAEFADGMTRSPSYGGHGRWWWPSNWGLNISQRRFERLSKRQFAEQLAQTEFGKKLLRSDRASIQRVLSELAYEFDRVGVAQGDYFRRRAKVLSGVFAFGFVAIGNINAIEIYSSLARNEAVAGRAISFVESTFQQAPTAEIEPQAADGTEVVSDYLTAIDEIQLKTRLPVGRAYFPFCEGILVSGETVARRVDDRCDETPSHGQVRIPFVDETLFVPSALNQALKSPGNWFVWLMSVVATAGLLGLGAPFWFDLFNRAASLAGRQVVQAKQAAAAEDSAVVASLPAKRGSEEANIQEMTDSFLIAGGQASRALGGGGVAPMGARLGQSSLNVVSGPSSVEGQPQAGLRRPPGAVRGNKA
ncbi:hypothetical protein [Hyphomonas sp.]|uniref:hypothetical protein n=1 Tax=Hyphomonas sp. TaxID=87 RepID=UPI001BCE86FD|nr:hypothetical protein [Hyphomonas sp.]